MSLAISRCCDEWGLWRLFGFVFQPVVVYFGLLAIFQSYFCTVRSRIRNPLINGEYILIGQNGQCSEVCQTSFYTSSTCDCSLLVLRGDRTFTACTPPAQRVNLRPYYLSSPASWSYGLSSPFHYFWFEETPYIFTTHSAMPPRHEYYSIFITQLSRVVY